MVCLRLNKVCLTFHQDIRVVPDDLGVHTRLQTHTHVHTYTHTRTQESSPAPFFSVVTDVYCIDQVMHRNCHQVHCTVFIPEGGLL